MCRHDREAMQPIGNNGSDRKTEGAKIYQTENLGRVAAAPPSPSAVSSAPSDRPRRALLSLRVEHTIQAMKVTAIVLAGFALWVTNGGDQRPYCSATFDSYAECVTAGQSQPPNIWQCVPE